MMHSVSLEKVGSAKCLSAPSSKVTAVALKMRISRGASCYSRLRFQRSLLRSLVLWCLIAIPECREVSEHRLKFPVDGFGTIEVWRTATITTPSSGPAAANIDNNLFEGVLAEHPGSWVLVLSDEEKFSGVARKDGRSYEITFGRDSANDRVNVASIGQYGARSGQPAITINEIRNESAGDNDKVKQRNRLPGRCDHGLLGVPPPMRRADDGIVGLKSNVYCRLRVVADSTFFRRIGQGLVERTELEIGWLLKATNLIFMNTVFRHGGHRYTRIGFKLGNISVYQRPDSEPTHFNADASSNMSIDRMLMSFATEEREENAKACGAVLLTARDFRFCGELGLAFVGSLHNEAGVCAGPRPTGSGSTITPNAVVLTAVHHNKRVSRVELTRALAHELAHLFGAEHDRDGGDPRTKQYIMSNSTTHSRRVQAFSRSSVTQMSTVLKFRQGWCFEELGSCGDGKVDSDEFCDEGVGGGPCCDEHCRLRSAAQCSEQNFDCCHKCRFAPAGKVCRPAKHNECLDAARCSGESERCPVSKPAEDGTACRNHGRCLAGGCQDYCTSIVGQTSCRCSSATENSCSVCCQRDLLSGCKPTRLNLEDGTHCAGGGRCVGGECREYCAVNGMTSCFCPGHDACKRCCLYDGICEPVDGASSLPEGSPCAVNASKVCHSGACIPSDIVDRGDEPAHRLRRKLIWLAILIVMLTLCLIHRFGRVRSGAYTVFGNHATKPQLIELIAYRNTNAWSIHA